MIKLFITGATGYIGGDFLFEAVQCHPDWNIACLIRDFSKGAQLLAAYPKVRVVYGDLSSASILEMEASRADIVFNFANADHLEAAKAISRGISRNCATMAFWIHTSGAGILTHRNFASNSYGYALDSDQKIYDDWTRISELTSLPNKALHRHVDKVVLSASSADPHRMKTAIVCPPCIWGVGRGTGNTTSVQVHIATRIALENGRGIQVGNGTNIWHEVHIQDLSKLYVLLGEAAATGGGQATWNEAGYYLVENGSFIWRDIISKIARESWLRGYLRSEDVESVDSETAKTFHRHFPYLCATTSRGVSKRARILLGWRPTQEKMIDHIPEIIRQEARRLKLTPRRMPQSFL